MHRLVVMPWRILRRIGGTSRDIAVEMLPEADRPPRPAPRASSAATDPIPSSSGVTPPGRRRKARPDAPANAEAAAEKADPASS